jgi:hypothetical protein
MDAKVVFYKQNSLDQNSKFKLRKELLGIEQKSNFSRYSYKIKGVLDEIPHYKPVDSAIIVENKHLNKIKKTLNKHKVSYEVFNINIPPGKMTRK